MVCGDREDGSATDSVSAALLRGKKGVHLILAISLASATKARPEDSGRQEARSWTGRIVSQSDCVAHFNTAQERPIEDSAEWIAIFT